METTVAARLWVENVLIPLQIANLMTYCFQEVVLTIKSVVQQCQVDCQVVKIASRSWVDVFQLVQHARPMVELSTLTSLVRKNLRNAVNVQTRILKAKIV